MSKQFLTILLICATTLILAEAAYLPPDAINGVVYTSAQPAVTTVTLVPTTTRPLPICSYNGYWLNCSNFDSFDQLSFKNQTYREQDLLIISPRVKQNLDEKFDLTGYNMKYSSLKLRNINKFPYLADESRNIKGKSLYFEESNIDFFYENVTDDLNSNCDSNLLENHKSRPTFFSAFTSLGIYQSNNIISDLCPYLFKDVSYTNFLTFLPFKFLKIEAGVDLNSSIRGFDLYNNIYRLDTDLVSVPVFEKITSLRSYDSQLEEIEEDFFKYFKFLKYMSLELNSLEDFFKKSDRKWIKNLNYEINADLNNITDVNSKKFSQLMITLIDKNNSYLFPDEDFCLFKDFPHHKLVYFQIGTKATLPCSCTLYWLHKHKNFATFSYPLQATASCLSNSVLFNNKIQECEFEERLERCRLEAATTTTTSTPSIPIDETTTQINEIIETTTLTDDILTDSPTEIDSESNLSTTSSVIQTSTHETTITTNNNNHGNKPNHGDKKKNKIINMICNDCSNISIVNNFYISESGTN